ncbi:hypothetical protein K8T06_13420 [bacterium]|nr:hypothetical protein [bacterium]
MKTRLVNYNGFSMLSILFSIIIILALLGMTLPLYTANARIQRSATERMQALWIIHGVLVEIQESSIDLPVKFDNRVEYSLPNSFPGSGDLTILKEQTDFSGLVKVMVSLEWTSLQGRKLSESLSEYVLVDRRDQ